MSECVFVTRLEEKKGVANGGRPVSLKPRQAKGVDRAGFHRLSLRS